MEKREYKHTGNLISLLGLGCMRLPKLSPDKEDIDYEKAFELVDYAYQSGINYFDTAHMYHAGTSEEFVGKALKRYPRDSFYLATKMPIWMADTPADMKRIFDLQLQRLQTDYFDFYLFHSLNRDHFKRCIDFGLYDFLQKKKEEGVIRQLGFSFHDTPDVLEIICQTYKWDFAQIQLNYLDWTMQDAKRQYEILEEHGLPCIVMEPVRGGALASPCEKANELFLKAEPDRSIASWAIRYAASFPNVMTVLSGMSNLEQLKDNIQTMTDFQPITEEEKKIIQQAVEAYRTKDLVPCTGCRYCMDCPMGVDIPKLFQQYNQYLTDQDAEQYRAAYTSLAEKERADSCIACGKCAQHCPQSITIPDKIAMIRQLTGDLF